MCEPNKLLNMPESATRTTNGSYINTILTGEEEIEISDHTLATSTAERSTYKYTILSKNTDPSVYESIETNAQDKDQEKTPPNGVLATITKKEGKIIILVLLVLIILLVIILFTLVSILVSRNCKCS